MTTPKSDLAWLLEALDGSDYCTGTNIRDAIELKARAEEAAQDTTWRNPEVAAKRAEQEQPNSLGDDKLTAEMREMGWVKKSELDSLLTRLKRAGDV